MDHYLFRDGTFIVSYADILYKNLDALSLSVIINDSLQTVQNFSDINVYGFVIEQFSEMEFEDIQGVINTNFLTAFPVFLKYHTEVPSLDISLYGLVRKCNIVLVGFQLDEISNEIKTAEVETSIYKYKIYPKNKLIDNSNLSKLKLISYA